LVERLVWDQEVAGSNPVAPISFTISRVGVPRISPGLDATLFSALFHATLLLLLLSGPAFASLSGTPTFPQPVHSMPAGSSLWETLVLRVQTEPLNLAATLIFLGAILHTFFAPAIQKKARQLHADAEHSSFPVEALHFFGEVEAIFGIWAIPLLAIITGFKGWHTAESYVNEGVQFTEALFVVVIMSIAATRPVLQCAQACLGWFAQLGKSTPGAWWLAILTGGPLLGSLITEPAAMTICALLLSKKVFDRRPSGPLAYATLGLLFVNVSVGGTLTHFAAPPVLMVVHAWHWDTPFLFAHFGWKAATAIAVSNGAAFLAFRRQLGQLARNEPVDPGGPESWEGRADPVPKWITGVHLGFLAWTVFTAHSPALFIGSFLVFLAFTSATHPHQNRVQLQPALLVGFFLAGLVIHGGLQGWWIAPVLESLAPLPLLLGSTALTAFNDNAAITFLATLVPDFGPQLQHLVVSGAVCGGGLTVIANAPNPAGQNILAEYFPEGISPLRLFLAALPPTIVALLCLTLLP
jgi:hypothetical protein